MNLNLCGWRRDLSPLSLLSSLHNIYLYLPQDVLFFSLPLSTYCTSCNAGCKREREDCQENKGAQSKERVGWKGSGRSRTTASRRRYTARVQRTRSPTKCRSFLILLAILRTYPFYLFSSSSFFSCSDVGSKGLSCQGD